MNNPNQHIPDNLIETTPSTAEFSCIRREGSYLVLAVTPKDGEVQRYRVSVGGSESLVDEIQGCFPEGWRTRKLRNALGLIARYARRQQGEGFKYLDSVARAALNSDAKQVVKPTGSALRIATVSAATALESAQREIGELREALEKCRDRFREYSQHHAAKLNDQMPDGYFNEIMRKSQRNTDMAKMCDAALNKERS